MSSRVTRGDRQAAAVMEGLAIVCEAAAYDLERAGISPALLKKTAESYRRSAEEAEGHR